MFSEQLALILFVTASQMAPYQAKAPTGPIVEDGRHAMIRAVKEPELVAALSKRAKRAGMRKQSGLAEATMLASAD